MRSFEDYRKQLPDRVKNDEELMVHIRHAWHAGFSQRERDFIADDLAQVGMHKVKTAELQREQDARLCEDNDNDYLASIIRHTPLNIPDNGQPANPPGQGKGQGQQASNPAQA